MGAVCLWPSSRWWRSSPGYRWAGDGLLGDEPKYLRITESLYYDLDTDVGSGTRVPPTPAGVLRNVVWLVRTAAQAAAELFDERRDAAGRTSGAPAT